MVLFIWFIFPTLWKAPQWLTRCQVRVLLWESFQNLCCVPKSLLQSQQAKYPDSTARVPKTPNKFRYKTILSITPFHTIPLFLEIIKIYSFRFILDATLPNLAVANLHQVWFGPRTAFKKMSMHWGLNTPRGETTNQLLKFQGCLHLCVFPVFL